MTLNEFMVELEKTKEYFDWSLEYGNMITGRLKTDNEKMFCPLTAVHYYKTGQYISMADYGCVDVDDPDNIVKAADGRGNKNIREKLLKELDIKE